MVNSSRTVRIGRDMTSQDKLSIFILDLFLFLLSAISTEQLTSIAPVNSLMDCRSTLGPQLYSYCIVYIFYYFLWKDFRLEYQTSVVHIFVSELSTCIQYLPFLMNGCIWTLIVLSLHVALCLWGLSWRVALPMKTLPLGLQFWPVSSKVAAASPWRPSWNYGVINMVCYCYGRYYNKICIFRKHTLLDEFCILFTHANLWLVCFWMMAA